MVAFIAVALIAAFIGFMGYNAMVNMKAQETEISVVRLPSIQSLLELSQAQTEVDSAENALLAEELDENGRQAQFTRITNALDQAESGYKIYEPLPQTQEEAKLWQQFIPAWKQWKNDDADYVRLAKEFHHGVQNESLHRKMVDQALITNGVSFAKVKDLLNKIIQINKDVAIQARKNTDAVFASTSIILLIVILIGMAAAIGLGTFISQIISRPVNKLVEAAKKISEGDINVKPVAATKDEIGNLSETFAQMVETLQNLIAEIKMLIDASVEGKLNTRGDISKFRGGYREILEGFNNTLDAVIEPIKEASDVLQEVSKGNLQVAVNGNYRGDHAEIKNTLNSTIDSLNQVLSEISNAADQVAGGSQNVSQSSQMLSQGSTEQAASLEEITSSITEVAAQTTQNAVNANQANDLAMTAKDSAIQGNLQMKGMLKAMEEINDSSANISKIIKVIDEIAFQTNILALNAAVEAARAGQHGKGFAVVAEEVRNLAARSANAAKETTALIEGSIKKVEAGTKIATVTAEALNQIVENVSEATNLVAEIAAASNQQASAITQINQGIEQVSQVTQSNTATAEESASASEELSSQAELLKNMVTRFKIRKNQTLSQLQGLSSDVLKALEDLIAKKGTTVLDNRQGLFEAAASADSHSKVKITLDDSEFGKY